MIRRLICFMTGLVLMNCSPSKKAEPLLIATAANARFAMEEIVHAFTEKTGIPCEIVSGSSGKLTAQILEGAPFHLFVSADMKYPEEVFKAGYADAPPQVYALGSLVLWSGSDTVVPSLQLLKSDSISHIAIAHPTLAPYGAAAVNVLKNLRLYETLEPKFIYGESITQTNQFILTEAAQLGFTAKSVVRSPEFTGQGNWIEIDKTLYEPVAQGFVRLNRNDTPDSRAFANFLLSDEARIILLRYGYEVIDQE